jgi:hypothetical protein
MPAGRDFPSEPRIVAKKEEQVFPHTCIVASVQCEAFPDVPRDFLQQTVPGPLMPWMLDRLRQQVLKAVKPPADVR